MTITMSSFEIAALAANIADAKKAVDPMVLDTQDVSTLADYFVIASVVSRTQMKVLADTLVKALKARNVQPFGLEIDRSGRWTILDFGDVVIHLFHEDDRHLYKLERFWNHATELPRDVWIGEVRQAS